MKLQTKYKIRAKVLDVLGWAFSFTALVFVMFWIRDEYFHDFAHLMYKKADLINPARYQLVLDDYFKSRILPLFYWLLPALFVDVLIRKMLQKEEN